MNVLNIAWKFDHDSAFSEGEENMSDNNYFFAFKIIDEKKKDNQVFSFLGYLVGAMVFVLNKLKRLGTKGTSDQLVTLIKRNYANEMIINHIVKKYKIDVINLHWCGYGFLPTNSLEYILNIQKMNVFHHDWYHFTSGEHVPKILGGFKLADSLRAHEGLFSPLIQNVLVSSFQEQQVRNLRLQNFFIKENHLREKFVLANARVSSSSIYTKRILNSNQIVILFIGVRSGNYDNKGVITAHYILDELANSDVFSIGIGCDDTLPLSLSISALDPADIHQVISASDLTVITSRLETFSMVALESQFCKTPVVFRKSLAPSSFDDSNYLYPAKDDSDGALLDAVIEFMFHKRGI